jgi:type 1 glutamine amidotransferase
MKASRRNFISKSFLMGLGVSLIPNLFGKQTARYFNPSQDTEKKLLALPSLKDKSLLFVWGGWEGHEPQKCLNLLKPWMEQEGAKVIDSESLEVYRDTELMKNVDLIVQIYTMSKITAEQEEGLLKAIAAGTGIAGWHGGLCDAFRQNTDYQFMTGGQWVAHPGGVIDYSVKITDKNDAVTQGVNDFKMQSEQYYMHVDPNVKVLATTTFNGEHAPWIDGCIMPVMWKKMFGKGRVFYTSLGHVASDLEVPEALQTLKRGIRWAGGSKSKGPEQWINPVYPG